LAPPGDARPPSGRGRFLTIEGGEGAGKSTQARLLAGVLRGAGISVLLTREPGGAPGAERLRELLLHGGADWSPLAETLLHFAARAEHVAKTIRPALDRGEWVVCDRYSDSTLAYQGYGQGADCTAVATLARLIGLEPDLTVVLDVSVATGQARLAARGTQPDRYERLGTEFLARVHAGFRTIAAAEPKRCVVISAEPDVPEVARAVLAAVGSAFGVALRA
jgi:dTMP kinase